MLVQQSFSNKPDIFLIQAGFKTVLLFKTDIFSSILIATCTFHTLFVLDWSKFAASFLFFVRGLWEQLLSSFKPKCLLCSLSSFGAFNQCFVVQRGPFYNHFCTLKNTPQMEPNDTLTVFSLRQSICDYCVIKRRRC